MSDAWSTELGQWALAWRDYLRGQKWTPATPRPDGRPVFVPADCATCGSPLRVVDLHNSTPPDSVWHDEFECPKCLDGVVLDVPPVESADEAFAREIALAHEVCQDQVDADAAVMVSLPPVTLPFGGEESK